MTRHGAGVAGLLVAVIAGCSVQPAPSLSPPGVPQASSASASSAPTAPSATPPDPSPSPSGTIPVVAAGWRTIPTSATLGAAHLRDLALFRGSLVAVGEADGTDGRIWASPDGVSWSSIAGPLVLKGTVLRSIAVGDAGIAVVGWSETDAVVLFSPDGLHWSHPSLPGSHPGSSAISIAWHAGRFVAIGGGGEPNAAVSWSSADGLTWQRLSIVTEGNDESLASVVGGPEGFVVSGSHGPHGAIWTSLTGAAWSRVDLPASDTNDAGRLRYVSGTYFVLGSGGVVWLSADGRLWSRTVLADFGVGVFDIASTPAGLVAVGRSESEPGQPGLVALAGSDLRTWTTAPRDPVFDDGLAASVLMAPDGRSLVGVGMTRGGDSVFVLADPSTVLGGASGITLAISGLRVSIAGDGTMIDQIRMRVAVRSTRAVRLETGSKSRWPRFSVQQSGNHALIDLEATGPASYAAGSTTDYDLTFDIPAASGTGSAATAGDWVLGMLLIEESGEDVEVRLPFTVAPTP